MTKKKSAKQKAVEAEAAEEVGDEVPGASESGDDDSLPSAADLSKKVA